ncbi:MAG: LysR family transcriptional regulator [Pseudomonadota bacterium]
MLRNLDWSLIQAFLSVAEEGSLSAAARREGVSQPTLGRQIKALESALDLEVVQRVAKGLELTPAGASILPAARAMRDAMQSLTLTAATHSNALEGSVRISASEMTAQYILPKIVADIREAEPSISIEIHANNGYDNLLFHEADIAVRMGETTQLDVIARKLGGLELGLFASQSYIQRKGMPQDLTEMMSLDFIGLDKGTALVEGFRERGMDVTREWFKTRTDDNTTYFNLLCSGAGLGIVQARLARSRGDLVEIPLPLDLPVLPVWLAAHQGMRHTPRIRLVWDMLAKGLAPWVASAPTQG